ncbi:unnamed protein product [Bemisia tabaci]|uniref:SH2 domain-containing protein n=1 Tax=Bemisia tabaci TaxID=7038 RepID=A0A9P0AH65_BEMTA|nr:unnamed protein product [Bemisia tabaci]
MHSPFTRSRARPPSSPAPLPSRTPEIQRMYFYHSVDRLRAVQLVSKGEDGCYLVRPSSSPSSLTLTLWNSGQAYNIPIRSRPDRLYALGTRKPRELCFPSILDLIKYYEKNPIIVADGGSCRALREVKLTKSPPKQDF